MGVIPARLASTRLPRKALREIAGHPMISWVYRNARRSPLLTDLVVATDSPEIQLACEAEGVPVTMTREHPSGSDRVHEVLERTDADVYVNIQGDEPTLRPDHLELMLQPFLNGSGARVTTLKVAISAGRGGGPEQRQSRHGGGWQRALLFALSHPLRPGGDGPGTALQAHRPLRLHPRGIGVLSPAAAVVPGTGRKPGPTALPAKRRPHPRRRDGA